MSISKNYIIVNSVIVLATSLFLVFLLLLKKNDPNLPFWILIFGYLLFLTSIMSFIWNLKSVKITENGIQISRVILTDIIIDNNDIIRIEENRFKYKGSHYYSTFYRGYYLSIISKNGTYKTSSLNEPNYFQLRRKLKQSYGNTVNLDNSHNGTYMNWLYIIIMLIPSVYLLFEISKIV